MINTEKIRNYEDKIKGLKEKLKDECDYKKRQIIKLKISIEENRIKMERLK